MTNPDGPVAETPKNAIAAPHTEPSGTTGDVESQTPAGVSNILRRWKREDLLKKGSLALRAISLICSLLAFIIMASNKHGDGRNFDQYEPYRYVLAIAILSTLYTGLQVLRQVHELSTGKQIFSRRNLAMLDFFADQVVSYLLLSAASAGVPLTNSLREGADNIFTDSSASAISMEFLAFISLAVCAIISGYKLASQTYI